MSALGRDQIEILDIVENAWDAPLHPTGCGVCGKTFLLEQKQIGQFCPNCAKGKLQAQPALLRKEPPELMLPFEKEPGQLQQSFRDFVQAVWLRNDDFSVEKLLHRMTPVFLPMWLIDCDVAGEWKAEIGYDYQVKSTQEFYRNGHWTTREEQETRIRWEPRLGQLNRQYNNTTIPALENHSTYMDNLGSFHYKSMGNYQPEEVKDVVVLLPDLHPQNVWPVAERKLVKRSAEDCRKAAGGQHIRNFSIQAAYENLNWTQLLLPAYITFYNDDEGIPRLLYINAQTGQIGGVRMASQKKGWLWAGILAGAAFLTFILGLLSLLLSAILAPIAVAGIGLLILSFLFLLAAVFPAVWPWQWNRRQQAGRVLRQNPER